MIRKIILCLTLMFALAVVPQTSLAVPTKLVHKKTTVSKKSKKSSKSCHVSKSSHSKRKRSYSSSRKRHRSRSHRSYSRDYDEDSGNSYGDLEGFTPKYYKPYKSARNYESTPTYSSTPYKAGVVSTKPLMKVIPQRDGRFLLEPLVPKKKVGPTSKVDKKKEVNFISPYRLSHPSIRFLNKYYFIQFTKTFLESRKRQQSQSISICKKSEFFLILNSAALNKKEI